MSEANDESLALTTDSLLRIDVLAQIRKLAGAQLQGDWQLPSECVRLATHLGASVIELELAPARISVRAEGWRMPLALLEACVAIRRAAEDPRPAHAAMIELEGAGALALIVVAGTARMRLDAVLPTDSGWMRLRLADSLAELRAHEGAAPESASLRVEGLELDRRRARRHCLDACRFSPARIRVDHEAPPPPFDAAMDLSFLPPRDLPPRRSDPPLPSGQLAVTHEGDAPRVWLTRHGVVAAHFTAARGPAFDASLEVHGADPGVSDPRATGADLRAFGERLLPAMMDAFVARMDVLARQSRAPAQRRRLALLCLQGMEIQSHARALAVLPVFDRRDESGELRPSSLVDLRAEVVEQRGRRRLIALHPDDDAEAHDLREGCFILDDALRGRLASRLELDIQAPPLRPSDEAWSQRWRRGLRAFGRRVLELGSFARPTPRALPATALGDADRELIAALSRRLAPEHEVQLCEGDFAPRWSRGQLFLAVDHPRVAAARRACARDLAWVYPAALALSEGRAGFGELRRRWRPSVWISLR